MKSQDTKTSGELKREVDQQINKIRNDIDELQGRLTPGRFIDDAIFNRHGRNLGATFDHLKNNPIGTTFLSLGTILLMEDEQRHTMEWNARSRAHSMKDSISSVRDTIKRQLPQKDDSGPSTGEVAREKISHLKDAIQSKVSDIREKIPGKAEVKSKAAEVKNQVVGKVSELKDEVGTRLSDTASDTSEGSNFSFSNEEATQPGLRDKASDVYTSGKDKASDLYRQGRERASNIYQSGKERVEDLYQTGRGQIQNLDPLSYMALGAGLGALTGAALPLTEAETNLVESKFEDRITGFGSELQEALNECSSILKDLVIQDVKDYSFRPFK